MSSDNDRPHSADEPEELDGAASPEPSPDGEWRQVGPAEIFEPGHTFRLNVSSGQTEVLVEGDAHSQAGAAVDMPGDEARPLHEPPGADTDASAPDAAVHPDTDDETESDSADTRTADLLATAARLAAMDGAERATRRRVEAQRLDVRVADLDQEIKRALEADAEARWKAAAEARAAATPPDFTLVDELEETIEEAIQRLATLDGAAYLTALDDAAKTFNIRSPSTLDRLVQRKRERQSPPPGASGVTLPRGFRLDETGLWFQPLPSHQSPEPAPVFVCGPFEVLGEARDLESRAWGVAIHWLDHDRRPHIWSCPQRLVHLDGNAIAAELADAGLSCGTSKQAHEMLKQFLGALRTSHRLQSAERVGWHATTALAGFVSPETTVITTERAAP
jgi:hypothetical protein